MSIASRKPDFTLVVLGFQGSGKSSTGNSTLKQKCFLTGIGTRGTTKHMQRAELFYKDKNVTVVDTPALSNIYDITNIRKTMSNDEIQTAVYAIVISIGRFTQEERLVVGDMLKTFENVLNKRTFLVFTRYDELDGFVDDNESRLEAWLDTTPTIRDWIAKYNFTYTAIENSNPELHELIQRTMMESLFTFESTIQEVDSGMALILRTIWNPIKNILFRNS